MCPAVALSHVNNWFYILTGNWSGTPLPPLALRHIATRILEWVLLPSAAKKVGLDPPRRHLTLTCHVNHRLHFDKQLVRYSLASAGAPACCPQDSRESAAAFGS